MLEIKTLIDIKHPNILEIIGYNMDANIVKRDLSSVAVSYIALEIATWDLIAYVGLTGAFDEPLARFYFTQLINAVDHAH